MVRQKFEQIFRQLAVVSPNLSFTRRFGRRPALLVHP